METFVRDEKNYVRSEHFLEQNLSLNVNNINNNK